jgi:hypothetical protein
MTCRVLVEALSADLGTGAVAGAACATPGESVRSTSPASRGGSSLDADFPLFFLDCCASARWLPLLAAASRRVSSAALPLGAPTFFEESGFVYCFRLKGVAAELKIISRELGKS